MPINDKQLIQPARRSGVRQGDLSAQEVEPGQAGKSLPAVPLPRVGLPAQEVELGQAGRSRQAGAGGDEDAFLMVQFQKGSRDAFNTIFKKYQQMVVNVIARYIGDHAFAEDMAQEVFLRIYRAKNKYKPVTQFKYYLFTIVHNLCLNEIRDTIRRKTKPMDFDDKLGPAVNNEPMANSEDMEIRQDVKSAIESLPPQQRIAVILDKYENLSYEEIGRVMKLSVSAVKSILWRARQGLREKLKKYIT